MLRSADALDPLVLCVSDEERSTCRAVHCSEHTRINQSRSSCKAGSTISTFTTWTAPMMKIIKAPGTTSLSEHPGAETLSAVFSKRGKRYFGERCLSGFHKRDEIKYVCFQCLDKYNRIDLFYFLECNEYYNMLPSIWEKSFVVDCWAVVKQNLNHIFHYWNHVYFKSSFIIFRKSIFELKSYLKLYNFQVQWKGLAIRWDTHVDKSTSSNWALFQLLLRACKAWLPNQRLDHCRPGWGTCGPRENLIWPGSEFFISQVRTQHRVKTKLHDEQNT